MPVVDGARQYTSPYLDVIRAKIVLYAAEELNNDAMAARLDTWVAYPKLPVAADLRRNVVHSLVPVYGLNTVSQIAIGGDWSALRLNRLG